MGKTHFSIVIPAYNNAQYLNDSISSVLNQTYPNFELIVVNDASPDNAEEVIRSFTDSRIRYIKHDVNRGLSAARNSGISNSAGDYIALLDGDDYFHPDKLMAHAEFLKKNPDIGVTYNARFELAPSKKIIRGLWRPPLTVGLKELVFGYPFSPSDMVIRREWAIRVDMFDEEYVYVGEDLDFNCRLALAGCKFASVDRALNYRRYYSNRVLKNIPYFVDCTFQAMRAAFADPRCPEEVVSLQDEAFAGHYILWSAIAFTQNDIELGQAYCRAAVQLNPSLLVGRPPKIGEVFINHCILDEGRDHEELLRKLFRELPEELQPMAKQGDDWAVARGFLLKGIQAIIWDRLEEGNRYFAKAVARGAQLSKPILTQISYDLIDYETEFGSEAVEKVIQNLTPLINSVKITTKIKWSKGSYFLDRAYKCFNEKDYASCFSWIVRAVSYDPVYLKDRGVVKTFLLALIHQMTGKFSTYSLKYLE